MNATFNRFPLPATYGDFSQADCVIALKHSEHLPLVEERFAAFAELVQYWHVDDEPGALQLVEKEVERLTNRLRLDRSPRMIDVSHVIEHGMITYKGLPAPLICDYLSREKSRSLYAPGTEFQIGKLEMVANTGTYLDSPFHRYADGKDLSELRLEQLANLEAVVIRVDCHQSRTIGPTAFKDHNVRGKAVLVETNWDRHWRTDQYFEGHPFLTRQAAAHLVEAGAALVGIDSYNIDDTADGSRPAHTLLLGAEVPIVEHLRGLNQLPDAGFRFFAVPVKVKGMGTFPVRAFGVVAHDMVCGRSGAILQG